MRINLHNKTRYRDDDLRALIRGACSAAGVNMNLLHVDVVHARTDRVTGWAQYPSMPRDQWPNMTRTMRIRIPVPRVAGGDSPVIRVARVLVHEAMHLAGARHKDMTEEQFTCTMPTPWAASLPLRLQEASPKADPVERKAAARADRLEHAQAMLTKASTRLKRASTIEKKWARRVRMLERQ